MPQFDSYPLTGTLDPTDLFLIHQASSGSEKTAQVASVTGAVVTSLSSQGLLLNGTASAKANDFSTSFGTPMLFSGLAVPVTAGKSYIIRIALYLSCTGVGGYRFALSGLASASFVSGRSEFQLSTANGSLGGVSAITALGDSNWWGITPPTAGDPVSKVVIDVTITAATTGDIRLNFAQQSAAGTSTIKAGSYMVSNEVVLG